MNIFQHRFKLKASCLIVMLLQAFNLSAKSDYLTINIKSYNFEEGNGAIEFRNATQDEICLEKFQIPIRGFDEHIFNIKRKDDSLVLYTGKTVKRNKSKIEDYICLEPWGSLSVDFDVKNTYESFREANYIFYKNFMFIYQRNSSDMIFVDSYEAISNTIEKIGG